MLINNDDLRRRFNGEFANASQALWVGCERANAVDLPTTGTAGMVTFFGPCIRGAFIVAQGVDDLHSEADVDWIGEMANQLAGRVKSALYETGLDFIIAPPLYLHGTRLDSATSAAECEYTSDTQRGAVYSWALLNIVGPIPETPPAETALIQEGELMLF